MPKDDMVYLGHMLDMARNAIAKTHGLTRTQYDADENLRLALVHLIQVVGEAARRVSEPVRSSHPEIPWTEIIGMRHKVVHEYLNVDFDVVWQVVVTDLPALVAALEKIVPDAGTDQM